MSFGLEPASETIDRCVSPCIQDLPMSVRLIMWLSEYCKLWIGAWNG